jgi:hypothetical protein
MTRNEVCAALESVHLDIPWDPETVRAWSLACVLGRDLDDLGRAMGIAQEEAMEIWRRLESLASERTAAEEAGEPGATWEVLVTREDETVPSRRAGAAGCERSSWRGTPAASSGR